MQSDLEIEPEGEDDDSSWYIEGNNTFKRSMAARGA